MPLKDDLAAEVAAIFRAQWNEEETLGVPEPDDLRLNTNHAKDLKAATVLYADLDGSTSMVDSFLWSTAAEVYKTYLRCSSQLIRAEGGVIVAYDGDRVMGIFTGDSKCTSAVRAALRINHAVGSIIQPALVKQYPARSAHVVKHVIGIDTSELRAARVGVHGDNDLVWIGRAANYAAKLAALTGKATWITKAVYDSLHDSAKFANGTNMWTSHTWPSMKDIQIYSSNYHWAI